MTRLLRKILAEKNEKEIVNSGLYHNAKEIVSKNERLANEGKLDQCVYFEFNGYKIFNPFKDEKGRKKVDPKQYYGDAYEESDFNRVN